MNTYVIRVRGYEDYAPTEIKAESASKAKATIAYRLMDIYTERSFFECIQMIVSCKKKVENSHD